MKQVQNYLAIVLDGMAKGLFASLIVGVIIRQVGVIFNFELLITIGTVAQYMMGAAIGAGVAYSRGAKHFTILAAIVAGMIGSGAIATGTIGMGEPVGAFVAALIGIEAGKLIEGKTKFDLLLVPLTVILIGGVVGIFISPYLSMAMAWFGTAINELTTLQPLLMGVLIATIVGMVLSSPMSSAALCISIQISGLAAGAALAGCCAQMIGFAVSSFRENGVSGLLTQGIGTSKIQLPNIIKHPLIWIPPTIASAIGGGLATMVFHMETNSVGAGMGTSGLVGQLTTLEVMGNSAWLPILLLHFIIPAVISLAISEFMRKKNLIRTNDMKL